MARGKFEMGKWESGFAWRPVRLLGGSGFAWLRLISRRHVLTERNTLKRDYSDTPGDHPCGYGLRKHDINANSPPGANGAHRNYRGYDLELKSMAVGLQITITINDVFVRHSGVSKDLDELITKTYSFIDSLSGTVRGSNG